MQKGVAIPYVIAIILGIVVIGLIGYWLFTGGGKMGSKITVTECNEKAIIYCSEWRLKDFKSDDLPKIGLCRIDCTWDKYAPGCKGLGVDASSEANCKYFLGIS